MLTDIINLFHEAGNTIFWASATAGTTLFALRMLTALFGSALDVDDMDADSFEAGDDHHHEASSFKLFSLHSIAGFFMMFGWVGLACTQQFAMPYGNAFLLAFIAGAGTMLLTACIFRGALLLEGPGSIFRIEKTIGLVGTVYQRIPAHGQGKVHLMINGVTRELLAQSHDNKPIESFALVEVVNVVDHEIVEVIATGKDKA